MEPLWLGLSAPTILSSAGNLAQGVVRPFAAALERAAGIFTEPENAESVEGTSGLPDDEARSRLEEVRTDLLWRIREALRDAGVDLDEPFQLRLSSADGQVDVVSATPNKSLIEAILGAESRIAEDFQQLAMLQAQIARADGTPSDWIVTVTDADLQIGVPDSSPVAFGTE